MSSNALLWPSQGTIPERRLDKYKYLRLPSQGVGGEVSVNNAMAYEDLEIMAYEINWFDLAFLQRIPLTINGGQVPSTQNDFPLLINDTYPDLIGEVEAELRFAGLDKIQLEYEIQEFDNSTGELIAWIKKPTVSDGDIIFIYFDNLGALDEQNPNAVWDLNYNIVSHLDGTGIDSTVNAQDYTIFGTTTVPGKIGDALEFPGLTSDFLIRNPFTGFPTTEITCEYWIKSPSNGDGMVSYAVGTGAASNEFTTFDQDDFSVFIVGISKVSGIDVSDDVFHHIVITWRSSDGQLLVYVDDVLSFSSIHQTGLSFTANGSLVLGQEQDSVGGGFQNAQAFLGTLDEVRLSNIVRSADYVTTSFNNQNNPGIFYSTGAVQSQSFEQMGYE